MDFLLDRWRVVLVRGRAARDMPARRFAHRPFAPIVTRAFDRIDVDETRHYSATN
jgi:hypothetical protein